MCHFVNLAHVLKSTSNECKSERIYSNSYSNLYADLKDTLRGI